MNPVKKPLGDITNFPHLHSPEKNKRRKVDTTESSTISLTVIQISDLSNLILTGIVPSKKSKPSLKDLMVNTVSMTSIGIHPNSEPPLNDIWSVYNAEERMRNIWLGIRTNAEESTAEQQILIKSVSGYDTKSLWNLALTSKKCYKAVVDGLFRVLDPIDAEFAQRKLPSVLSTQMLGAKYDLLMTYTDETIEDQQERIQSANAALTNMIQNMLSNYNYIALRHILPRLIDQKPNIAERLLLSDAHFEDTFYSDGAFHAVLWSMSNGIHADNPTLLIETADVLYKIFTAHCNFDRRYFENHEKENIMIALSNPEDEDSCMGIRWLLQRIADEKDKAIKNKWLTMMQEVDSENHTFVYYLVQNKNLPVLETLHASFPEFLKQTSAVEDFQKAIAIEDIEEDAKYMADTDEESSCDETLEFLVINGYLKPNPEYANAIRDSNLSGTMAALVHS